MARKKQRRPSLEEQSPELEAQADKLLAEAEHDRKMLSAVLENTQTILDGFAQLKLPSNDPEYLKKLQDHDRNRSAIANSIGALHVYSDPDKGETWIGVSVVNRRHTASVIETARLMGEHFEAKVIKYD